MIPKPGKKLHLENLRSISLTLCLGKLLEHVVLNGINVYMEENELYPHAIVGFRAKLSTQDVMLHIKHQIIDGEGGSPLDTRAILGIDVTKAFDNVRHEAILEGLERLGTGKRVYNYFLSDRTASLVIGNPLTIGNIELSQFEMGSRGTPQGSVLSPFLFNTAMMGLPDKLNDIATLNHSLYANVTLWVAGSSDGHVQGTLQSGIDMIIDYVRPRGLKCSPQKSELLIYRPTSRGRRRDPATPNIELYAGSQGE